MNLDMVVACRSVSNDCRLAHLTELADVTEPSVDVRSERICRPLKTECSLFRLSGCALPSLNASCLGTS